MTPLQVLRNRLTKQAKQYRSQNRRDNLLSGHTMRLMIWAMLDHHGQAKPYLKGRAKQ